MRKIYLFMVWIAITSCSTSSTDGMKAREKALKPGQLPMELFFRNPVARDVVISPDGTMLASLQPFKGRMNVFVKKINDTEWINVTKVEDRDIATLQWKNKTLLFTKDFGGDENFHLFAVEPDGQNFRELTPYPNTKVQMVDALETISQDEVVISHNQRDPQYFDVYRLNIKTGQTTLLLENKDSLTSFTLDNKGVLRVAKSTDGANHSLYYRKDDKTPFKKVLTLNFKDQLAPIRFDKKNKNIYALTNINRDTSAVVEINPETGKMGKTLYSNASYDVVRLLYSRHRQELTVALYEDWITRRHFFSSYFKNIHDEVSKTVKDREIYLTSHDDKLNTFVVSAHSDRAGAHYYLYDHKTKKTSLLLNSTPWLKEEDTVEMKPIEYTSRDGLKIMGYLFLPKDAEPKNLPVVVNPHGGPWARDSWGFRADSQFLANRGYAVLQMNFRGSTGFGKKFWQSSFKQWGLKMQDDVTDGVAWLVQKEIADKDRVAIYGGSYGGYSTLAGLAFTPDLYRCGVDYVGVSNIFTLMETVPPYWKPMREMYYEMIGNPETEKELLTRASPVFHADKITAPLFVAQGAKDPRVKKSESDQIVQALKNRGVDVPYLVKDNEGHGFRNEENRFDFYKQMEAFLDRHMLKR
jgi:dipeptidyl aminopeptidase/acylaminoacyl peptidase